jgi:hypothetical protein
MAQCTTKRPGLRPRHLAMGLTALLGLAAAPGVADDSLRQFLISRTCVACNLSDTVLAGANLENAVLTDANLAGANLSQTRLLQSPDDPN